MYTYDDSVVDGVNVPARTYRIMTDVTEHGGIIEAGTEIIETPRRHFYKPSIPFLSDPD